MTLEEKTKAFKKKLQESVNQIVSEYEKETELVVSFKCERHTGGFPSEGEYTTPIIYSYNIVKL